MVGALKLGNTHGYMWNVLLLYKVSVGKPICSGAQMNQVGITSQSGRSGTAVIALLSASFLVWEFKRKATSKMHIAISCYLWPKIYDSIEIFQGLDLHLYLWSWAPRKVYSQWCIAGIYWTWCNWCNYFHPYIIHRHLNSSEINSCKTCRGLYHLLMSYLHTLYQVISYRILHSAD